MNRLLAQTVKDLRQFRRDRLTRAVAVVLPLVQLLLFGTVIKLNIRNIPLLVEDLDRTPLSRRLVDAYAGTTKFILVAAAPSEPVVRQLDAGRARAAVRIPPGFERDVFAGRSPAVQVLIDGTDANAAAILRNVSSALSQVVSMQESAVASRPAVKLQVRHWYNPGLADHLFFGSGALGMVMILMPALLGALAASREHEQGTIVQAYSSTLTAPEWVLGKALAYVAVGAAETVLCFGVGAVLFGYRLPSNPVPLFLATLLYLFAAVLYGMLMGNVIGTQAASMQAVQLGAFLLSMLLSGFLVPVSNIPAHLRWISWLLPARHYIEVVRDSLLRGGGWESSGPPVIGLALLAALFLAGNIGRMRRMQFSD